MEIEITQVVKYKPKAGDILSWQNETDKILFAVLRNEPDKLVGITLFDSRKLTKNLHVVIFNVNNRRLNLVCTAEDADRQLDSIIVRWSE